MNGNLELSYSTFSFVTKVYTVYHGQSSIKKLTLETINESSKLVADEDVYPEAPSHITRVIKADGHFFKRPALTFYDEIGGSGKIAKELLLELEMLELLERDPHPNIMRYHSCQVHRSRILGLVLERYPYTLEERMRNGGHDLNLKVGFDGIKSGMGHHSLRLAHNDIKASNIMVDADNTWILVDIGPFGENLSTAGIPEWETSSQQHDDDALSELLIWLTDRLLGKF